MVWVQQLHTIMMIAIWLDDFCSKRCIDSLRSKLSRSSSHLKSSEPGSMLRVQRMGGLSCRVRSSAWWRKLFTVTLTQCCSFWHNLTLKCLLCVTINIYLKENEFGSGMLCACTSDNCNDQLRDFATALVPNFQTMTFAVTILGASAIRNLY